MRIVSLKKRSAEEVANIIQDFKDGISYYEISKKYQISDASIYRIIQRSMGGGNERSKAKATKIDRLEKELKEREKEIALLKAALKKY